MPINTCIVHAFMCIYVWYLTVTLSGSGRQFRGFLIQARLMSDDTTRVGSFSNPPSGTRLSSCSPSEVCEWRIQMQNIFVNHELEKRWKCDSFLLDVFTHTLTWNVMLSASIFNRNLASIVALNFTARSSESHAALLQFFCSRNLYSAYITISVKLNSKPL